MKYLNLYLLCSLALATVLPHQVSGQSIIPAECYTNEFDDQCETCPYSKWTCGGVGHYKQMYCSEVILEIGDTNNTVGCTVPSAICTREDGTVNGTAIDWDVACGDGVPCTQEHFDAFVEAEYAKKSHCESLRGVTGECCDDPCVTLDCFCPTSNKPANYGTYACSDPGTVIAEETDETVISKEPNRYCYEDCLCCFTEECCMRDTCRPTNFLGPGETECCHAGCDWEGPSDDASGSTKLLDFCIF